MMSLMFCCKGFAKLSVLPRSLPLLEASDHVVPACPLFMPGPLPCLYIALIWSALPVHCWRSTALVLGSCRLQHHVCHICYLCRQHSDASTPGAAPPAKSLVRCSVSMAFMHCNMSKQIPCCDCFTVPVRHLAQVHKHVYTM